MAVRRCRGVRSVTKASRITSNSCTLKLTHLPEDVTESSLLRFIQNQAANGGRTALRIFRDRVDMIEHSYALINYSDEISCKIACSLLNGKKINGVPIRAKVKGTDENTSKGPLHPREPQPLKQPDPPPVVATVKVELRGPSAMLSQAASDQLFEYFSQFGPVKDKPIVRTGDPYYAYVNFGSQDAASKACRKSFVNLGSIQLKIKLKASTTTAESSSPQALEAGSNAMPRQSHSPALVQLPHFSSASTRSCTIKVELHGPHAGSLSGYDIQKYFEHLVGDVEARPIIHKGDPYFAYVNFSSPDAAAKACEKKSIVLNQVKVTIKLSTKAKPVEVDTKAFTSDDALVDRILASSQFNAKIQKKLELFRVTISESEGSQSSLGGIQVTGTKDNVEQALVLLDSETDAIKCKIVKKSLTLNCCAVPLIFSTPDLLQSLEEEFCVELFVLHCSRRGKSQYIEKEALPICTMLARYFKASAIPVKVDVLSNYFTINRQKFTMPVSWSFKDDNDEFVKMSNSDSKVVEAYYQSYLKLKSKPLTMSKSTVKKHMYVLAVGKFAYSYDFSIMRQTNTSTLKVRKIIRNDSQGNAPRNITVLCRGLEDSVSASLTELQEAVEESYIEVDLEFENDLQAAEMSKIANEYFVCVRQLVPGKLSIVGEPCYVDKVIVDIKVRMSHISTVKPPLSATESIGPHWEPQSDKIELKNVSSTSSEWRKIENHFKETLQGSQLTSIQRIQNKWLWGKYAFCRIRMRQKNGEAGVNEKLLFHGSRQTPPDSIYKSEHGFDFRFGSHGLWGKGAYFAVSASYSNQYAYDSTSDDGSIHSMICSLTGTRSKQMFVAYVLTGDSCATKQDSTLDKPPVKNSSTLERYDSVNGETGSSKIYIVYDHDKSYPAYLITYR